MNLNSLNNGKYWDRAWSLVEGCSPVSEGCLNCWSASQTRMRSHQKNPKIRGRYKGLTKIHNGRPTFNGRIRLMWDDLQKPLRIKTPTVWSVWNDFLCAPPEFIDAAFDVIGACPEHTFLILTKRPEKLESKIYDPTPEVPIRHLGSGDYFPNVYWGVTVECPEYIYRVEYLLDIPGKHFVIIEPCLGLVDISHSLGPQGLDGVIVGGETGPRARLMHPEWARKVRDDCVATHVPFFFKQWGEYVFPDQMTDDTYRKIDDAYNLGNMAYTDWRVGKKAAGRLLDGREWNELPWSHHESPWR